MRAALVAWFQRRAGLALAVALAAAAAIGCSSTVEPGGPDPMSEDYDLCAEQSWYGDGECDIGCAEPDPDCMPEECDDACADLCDATWSGAAAPAVPDGCSTDPVACDCGDAPVECPDVCEAECAGEAVPAVPEGCPVMDACDCADVLPGDGDPAPQSLTGAQPLALSSCATADPSSAEDAEASATAARLSAEATARAARRTRSIPIAFHVLREPPINEYYYDKLGDVPRRVLIRQLRVINRAFAHTSFKFRIKMITRHTSKKWFYADQSSREEGALKGSLHRGGPGTLNVYTFWGGPGSWSSFPWSYTAHPKSDGVMLDFHELPGGESQHFNRGDMLVHEAGHWLGLYHTFMFGCSKNHSDGVTDTPTEASAARGCRVGRDSCPGQRGDDPIHNYMDYSDDTCINQFTLGQRKRMNTMSLGWRDIRGRASGASSAGGDDGDEGVCGNAVCDGNETDVTCPGDCGCARVACGGVAPSGCTCDTTCGETGDCCADADTCQ